MVNASATTGISTGRLQSDEYDNNFGDLHAPLGAHQAHIEAARCYFCFDAPCMTACPTSIDIPLFIRQITTGNTNGSARTIFAQNIMGGMCARVCPTETLCEEACVRNDAEGKPVKIGHLQRYATDSYMKTGQHPFSRGPATGKKVAVVGGGPAGMSCAHRLASLGHAVSVFEARGKSGGLNEYGIASYKAADNFAAKEIDFILSIGGIEVKVGSVLGSGLELNDLREEFDAVFLGLGQGGANDLCLAGEDLGGVINAIDYIAELRQAYDLAKLPVGRRIVVIGGGMTAIDIAVQTKLLGAEEVTIVYRRGQEHMKASRYEQELAQTHGVKITHWAKPAELVGEGGYVRSIRFEGTALDAQGKLVETGESFELTADMVFKAIGQVFLNDAFANNNGPELAHGRIAVDGTRKTSLPDVWAGGDCIDGGEDLTVAAVEDGKVAAMSIDQYLRETK